MPNESNFMSFIEFWWSNPFSMFDVEAGFMARHSKSGLEVLNIKPKRRWSGCVKLGEETKMCNKQFEMINKNNSKKSKKRSDELNRVEATEEKRRSLFAQIFKVVS